MELCVQTLMCGLNGTGVSTLLEARRSFEGYGYGCGGGEVRGRLLVNAGDGLTRFCADRGVRLACIEAVLVTSLAPHCTAGLVSLLLALSSVGAAQITIIGPQGIQDLCASFGLIFNRR